MKAETRKKEIAEYLMSAQKAITGDELSRLFGVSRQTIVKYVSELNDGGYEIFSTHFGYVIAKTPYLERVFKVRHTSDQTEDELTAIVKLGGVVSDVFVWHKVYGKISVRLNICSLEHISKYVEGVRSGKSSELMHVTGGYHYHTVRAKSDEVLDLIERELVCKGYLVKE